MAPILWDMLRKFRNSLVVLIMLVIMGTNGCGDGAKVSIDRESQIASSQSSEISNTVNEKENVPEKDIPELKYKTGNSEFDAIVNKVVVIADDQQLEKAEWIEEGNVYRVAIERKEEAPEEYRHLKDYIFVKTDGIKWFEVDYASKKDSLDADRYVGSGCDFEVLYEDVTFDGEKDILISLGGFGTSSRKYCAYINSEEGFVYDKSFEKILFDHIDAEKRCIVGFVSDGYGRKIGTKYAYFYDGFELIEETVYEFDDKKGEYVVKDIFYDTTYVKKQGGRYVYRLTDKAIIEKYDELYADAFADTIESYNDIWEYNFQSYNPGKSASVNNLVYRENEESELITVGSNFEMDYNFDLNNVGYTYVDLNSDGIFELIFGVIYNEDDKEKGRERKDYIERAYALVDGHVVKFIEGGCKILHYLGSDGYIYEYEEGGAAYWGYYRLHFAPHAISDDGKDLWGSRGLLQDEFVGSIDGCVHIQGSADNIRNAAQVPESAISDEECDKLMDEWESRGIDIDWIRLSDYLEKHSLTVSGDL